MRPRAGAVEHERAGGELGRSECAGGQILPGPIPERVVDSAAGRARSHLGGAGKGRLALLGSSNCCGFRGKNPRQALVAEFTREGAEVLSHGLRWALRMRGYGFYTGTFNGDITVAAGAYCELDSSTVGGNLTSNGGTVVLRNTTVTGNLQISGTYTGTGPNQHMVCGSTIEGNLQFQNDTDPIIIGGPSGTSCGPSTVGGNLQVQNSSAAINVTYDNIGGNLQVQNNTGPVTVTDDTTKGDLQVRNNTGGVTVDTNTVGGNLQVQNNSPSTDVSSNTVAGNLQCNGNTGSISDSGGTNTAKQKQGQCATF